MVVYASEEEVLCMDTLSFHLVLVALDSLVIITLRSTLCFSSALKAMSMLVCKIGCLTVTCFEEELKAP